MVQRYNFWTVEWLEFLHVGRWLVCTSMWSRSRTRQFRMISFFFINSREIPTNYPFNRTSAKRVYILDNDFQLRFPGPRTSITSTNRHRASVGMETSHLKHRAVLRCGCVAWLRSAGYSAQFWLSRSTCCSAGYSASSPPAVLPAGWARRAVVFTSVVHVLFCGEVLHAPSRRSSYIWDLYQT